MTEMKKEKCTCGSSSKTEQAVSEECNIGCSKFKKSQVDSKADIAEALDAALAELKAELQDKIDFPFGVSVDSDKDQLKNCARRAIFDHLSARYSPECEHDDSEDCDCCHDDDERCLADEVRSHFVAYEANCSEEAKMMARRTLWKTLGAADGEPLRPLLLKMASIGFEALRVFAQSDFSDNARVVFIEC